MASLRGEPGAVWTLREATDALAQSARQGAVPSGLWVAGFFYQTLSLGWTFGLTVLSVAVPGTRWEGLLSNLRLPLDIKRSFEPLVLYRDVPLPIFILLCLVSFRVVAGLARLSPREVWLDARGHRRAPKLRQAWRAGKGLTRATMGLWIQLLLMMFFAALIFVGPARLLIDVLNVDGNSIVSVLVSGIAVGLILFYGFLLSIVFQIALHSLVQNRRGVASALLHAWRIAKNDPMATARATIVDAVLYFTVAIGLLAAISLLRLDLPLLGTPILAAMLLLEALAGCTRCAYWARAYRALGGISTLEAARVSDAD